MNSERYARIKEIFAHARELPDDERGAYLDDVCAGDADLRSEVEGLLESDATDSKDALDLALSDDAMADEPIARPRRIGQYRILSVCGSGGMGTVYEAEQDTPHRRVALKVIQSATPRPDLLRRFRRETEILARLQHPCIAQIFEAGEFEQDGVSQPYFAMEFVDGAPLLDFAAKQALDVSARLDVFARICDAIHYAHQQGVVHRDLKPDNILVVESSVSLSTPSTPSASSVVAGQPKILDFGVASLADSEARMTMATDVGQLIGSVPYMSPEQATGDIEHIDARSDIYALGVLLFELLTGKLPYEVKHRALADALHTIRYTDPAQLGSADPGLRGDLETIVGKCLEKDPERRYDSVGTLVEDVRRFRELKPITARPPSTWYQMKRFAQRNRALVGGAATTLLAIVGGAILAIVLAIQATHHANAAREAQAHSDRQAYRANLGAASALLESDPAHARRILDRIPEDRRGWEWQLLSSTLSSSLLEFGEVVRRTPPRHHPSLRFHDLPSEDMHLLAGGEEVVALAADDRFCIWRTRTGEVARTFTAPGKVAVFAAARDGNLLAAALDDDRVVTCDPRDESPTWSTWFESDTRVDALAVAPAGDRIAIDRPNEVRIGTPGAWRSAATGERTYFFPPDLEFTRDGTQLARQFRDVVMLDVETGEVVGEPMESVQGHWALAVAPDKQRVAIGQMRRELRLFDPATGEMEFELLGHNFEISDVAYGDDSNRLLSVSLVGGTIRVWDLERREQIAIFDAPNTTRAEFLDDDHVLSLTDGRFRLWTLRDRRARRLEGNRGHVFGTVFSGDGDLLATSAPWGDVVVWDALEGVPLYRAEAHRCDHLAFDREAEHLFAGLNSGVIRTGPGVAQPWTGGPAVPLPTPERPLVRHAQHHGSGALRIQGAAVPTALDGLHAFRTEHLLEANGGRVRAFVDGEELALPLPHAAADVGPYPQLVLGPDFFTGTIAEFLVIDGLLSNADAAAVDTYLRRRRAGRSAALPELAGLLAHFRADEDTVGRFEDDFVRDWTASNDPGLVLVSRGGPRTTKYLPAADGQPAHLQFKVGYGSAHWMDMPLPAARDAEAITVCWLGGYPATDGYPAGAERTAYSIESLAPWWEGRDPRIVKTGQGAAHTVDSRYYARVVPHPQTGGTILVTDTSTGKRVAQFDEGNYHYYCVSFHPDGRTIACGSKDGTIDVYDVETRELLQRIEAHTSHCWDVAFSPDGKILASGGNDNALRLWDGETYEPLLELPGHPSYVRCVNWSADGTRLVSGAGDRAVRIWDVTPRSERYAQLLANRRIEREVEVTVRELAASAGPDRPAVVQEIRERFGGDTARVRAALRVFARMP